MRKYFWLQNYTYLRPKNSWYQISKRFKNRYWSWRHAFNKKSIQLKLNGCIMLLMHSLLFPYLLGKTISSTVCILSWISIANCQAHESRFSYFWIFIPKVNNVKIYELKLAKAYVANLRGEISSSLYRFLFLVVSVCANVMIAKMSMPIVIKEIILNWVVENLQEIISLLWSVQFEHNVRAFWVNHHFNEITFWRVPSEIRFQFEISGRRSHSFSPEIEFQHLFI